jgi:hypothetical protein
MFLTQADLENEQVYWRMKRRLTNRSRGTGVVWGLCLSFNFTTRRFRLSPGYALDCCGNDLVVECPIEVTDSELWQRADASLLAPSLGTANRQIKACVVLQYVECAENIRPVHRDGCGTSGSACEPSRVRETVRLLLVPECSEVACDPIVLFRRRVDALRGSNARATTGNTLTAVAALVLASMQSYLATAERRGVSVEARLMASYAMSMATSTLGLEVPVLDDATLGGLSSAVDELAAAFCDAYCYPGPRCRDEHHGVYLGCVTLSPTGAVQAFDRFQCRRHVLTGPLLNWWLCVFGVPPIDQSMGELFEMLCEAEEATEDPQGPVILRVRDMIGAVDSGVSDTRAMSSFDLLATLARAATGPQTGPGLVGITATAPNGAPLRAVVPAASVRTPEVAARAERLAETELAADRAVQPLSRAPLRDLVAELARRVPASGVAANLDVDTTRALGTMTVSEVIDTGPESMLVRIGSARATDAHGAATNALFVAMESFVRDAAAASAPAGRKGITRSQLENAELRAALARLPGVTVALVDAAAKAAAKR